MRLANGNVIGRALAVAALMLCGHAGVAEAAAPSNDKIGGAIAVSIGYSQMPDTTQATTDSDDAQLNASCGAPATDASVWYTFTPTSDTGVVVDVSQSDYSAGVLVGVGTPGNLTTVACGPRTVGFAAAANTTYYVLAIDDQLDGGGNGGTLEISFNPAPPPPTIDIAVDAFGTFDAHTGVATLSGTFTCENGDFVEVLVDAYQMGVGRLAAIHGSGSLLLSDTCDGKRHPWSMPVFPMEGGKFAGGKALTLTLGFTCGAFDCADGYVERTVQLRGK